MSKAESKAPEPPVKISHKQQTNKEIQWFPGETTSSVPMNLMRILLGLKHN